MSKNCSIFYMKCTNCDKNIKRISKFRDLIFKKDLVCQNCNNKFAPNKILKFFIEIISAINIVLVFVFAYYSQKFLFPNIDKMKLISFVIGIFLYFAILIFLNYLIPYKNTNLKLQGK